MPGQTPYPALNETVAHSEAAAERENRWRFQTAVEFDFLQRGYRLRDAFPRFCKNLFSKVTIIDRPRENEGTNLS